jgi:hypothetical protein
MLSLQWNPLGTDRASSLYPLQERTGLPWHAGLSLLKLRVAVRVEHHSRSIASPWFGLSISATPADPLTNEFRIFPPRIQRAARVGGSNVEPKTSWPRSLGRHVPGLTARIVSP